jgi:hypothetical protein
MSTPSTKSVDMDKQPQNNGMLDPEKSAIDTMHGGSLSPVPNEKEASPRQIHGIKVRLRPILEESLTY